MVERTNDQTGTPLLGMIVVFGFVSLMLIQYIGSAAAYAFTVTTLSVTIFWLRPSIAALARHWQIWVFAGFCLLSTVWSQQPWWTLRYALEFIITVIGGVLAARYFSPKHFLAALSWALMVAALLSVAVHRYAYDGLTQTMAFVGIFGSKNQMAFFISLLATANLAIILSSEYNIFTRIINCAAIPLAILLLYLSQSLTSKISCSIAILVLLANHHIAGQRTTHRARMVLGLLFVFFVISAIAIIFGEDIFPPLLHEFGKDTTLTGRTELWARAWSIIAHHPLLGIGYSVFWLPGYAEPEAIWHLFNIQNPSGFSFHNTYLETTVELGYVGCIIFGYFLVTTLGRAVFWSWGQSSWIVSFYASMLSTLILRSFVEVEMTSQFYLGSVLFYAIMYYAYEHTHVLSTAKASLAAQTAAP